ncbi:hypothetical protein M2189_006733 [Bradyrhizobium japonicum]|uniref:hypothetical protein n=1 Tax=Bradyrhizobium japonicum TaxID=375 RepID=UPI00216731CF|nr:hypothetical protein [Bradyrhizobium japonicum]MCS3503750.1 hypothetical protein [Bradyrhizobium japonicum]MCS3963530.1 hypothetical protein [Bradyrhizobium japonicum]MCS3995843.1 hypothetical protein [Bradyrhizobium japonicum]
MTKAENRAAARAYHQERMRQRDEEARARDVAADLTELGRLRHYLIFGRKDHRADREKLMNAIDDYVGEMTGDRTTLHAQNHKCG